MLKINKVSELVLFMVLIAKSPTMFLVNSSVDCIRVNFHPVHTSVLVHTTTFEARSVQNIGGPDQVLVSG